MRTPFKHTQLKAHLNTHTHNTQGLQLKRHIEATLGSGNIMDAVKLPPGEEFEVRRLCNLLSAYAH